MSVADGHFPIDPTARRAALSASVESFDLLLSQMEQCMTGVKVNARFGHWAEAKAGAVSLRNIAVMVLNELSVIERMHREVSK